MQHNYEQVDQVLGSPRELLVPFILQKSLEYVEQAPGTRSEYVVAFLVDSFHVVPTDEL